MWGGMKGARRESTQVGWERHWKSSATGMADWGGDSLEMRLEKLGWGETAPVCRCSKDQANDHGMFNCIRWCLSVITLLWEASGLRADKRASRQHPSLPILRHIRISQTMWFSESKKLLRSVWEICLFFSVFSSQLSPQASILRQSSKSVSKPSSSHGFPSNPTHPGAQSPGKTYFHSLCHWYRTTWKKLTSKPYNKLENFFFLRNFVVLFS